VNQNAIRNTNADKVTGSLNLQDEDHSYRITLIRFFNV